ncbi:MAG: hypothetical protein D6750_10345 [Bacteroidetes bacterium]|nr:MAG: hypothetical protein D6750_10345 [Bacteroidota bacterium]
MFLNGTSATLYKRAKNIFLVEKAFEIEHDSAVVQGGFASGMWITLDHLGNLYIKMLFEDVTLTRELAPHPLGMVTGPEGAFIWYKNTTVRVRVKRVEYLGEPTEYEVILDECDLPTQEPILQAISWGLKYAYLTADGKLFVLDEDAQAAREFTANKQRPWIHRSEYAGAQLAANDDYIAVYIPGELSDRWPVHLYDKWGDLSFLKGPEAPENTDSEPKFVPTDQLHPLEKNPVAIRGAGNLFVLVYGKNLVYVTDTTDLWYLTPDDSFYGRLRNITDVRVDNEYIYIVMDNQDTPVAIHALDDKSRDSWRFLAPDRQYYGSCYSEKLKTTVKWALSEVLLAYRGKEAIGVEAQRIVLPDIIINVRETEDGFRVDTCAGTRWIKEGLIVYGKANA